MTKSSAKTANFIFFTSFSLLFIGFILLGLGWKFYVQEGVSLFEVLYITLSLAVLAALVLAWLLSLINTRYQLPARWLTVFSKWTLHHMLYYLARFFSFICWQKKQNYQESFLHYNNKTVVNAARGKRHQNILLLLPHCLQNSKCKIRITTDIEACASCGKCDIAVLKALVHKYHTRAAVATGGSLARKIIKDTKPELIVAVACHRDLTEGVRDAWQYPVYAVLNERPHGPCFETTVNINTIENTLRKFQ